MVGDTLKFIKELIPYIVIIIVVVLFRSFIATPVRVDGSSMVPTLKNNDILILNKLSKDYKRFDIVVVEVTVDNHKTKLVKRVIGLPGENIEYINNTLYINGKKVEDVTPERTDDFTLKSLYGKDKIPEGYYFVMGDNRNNSADSRTSTIGLIKKGNILGKTIFRIWPINKMGTF